MTPTYYNACAAYYESLAEDFRKQAAWDSVSFYRQVAQRCREYAGYAREAA